MLYEIVTIAGKEYKLRLTAQACEDVEKRLGKSVLDVLLEMAPNDMPEDGNMTSIKGMSTPKVGDICTILHGALQKFQHGITREDVLNLYDEHIDAGGEYNDFFPMLFKTLQVSGFLPKGAEIAPAEQAQPEENASEA